MLSRLTNILHFLFTDWWLLPLFRVCTGGRTPQDAGFVSYDSPSVAYAMRVCLENTHIPRYTDRPLKNFISFAEWNVGRHRIETLAPGSAEGDCASCDWVQDVADFVVRGICVRFWIWVLFPSLVPALQHYGMPTQGHFAVIAGFSVIWVLIAARWRISQLKERFEWKCEWITRNLPLTV